MHARSFHFVLLSLSDMG